MTKLYYTDPLKAAWMAREFGVEYTNFAENNVRPQDMVLSILYNGKIMQGLKTSTAWRDNTTGEIYGQTQRDKFTIHPNSCRIFEPQEWDVGFNADGLLIQYYEGMWRYQNEPSLTPLDEIISRNGKAFFTPEKELK